MAEFPTEQELQELREFDQPFALTIYAPYIEPNNADNPNRIELKNLVKEAQIALESAGVKPRQIKKTLNPIRDLLEGPEFWPIQHVGLALFAAPGYFRYYRMPVQDVPYTITLERGFDLRPLELALANNESYVVLALGHKDVRVYEGDHYQLQEVHIKDFPGNVQQALRIDELPQAEETHPIAPASEGKGSRAYHGQYNVSQTDKQMLLEFFRRIDRRLHKFLLQKRAPLIVAGVNYLLPIYRQANTYPQLVPYGIAGNVEHASTASIRNAAWSILSNSRP